MVGQSLTKLLYESVILPHMDYMDFIYGSIGKLKASKINMENAMINTIKAEFVCKCVEIKYSSF